MKLTVFTPTYNRADKIEQVYQSILQSVSRIEGDSVEWLVVDDGSTDQTEDTVKRCASSDRVEVRYVRKQNGGKHTAFNLAIEQCKGDIFVCIDDDDYLTPNALEDIFAAARKYDGKGYSGFVGRVVDPNGKLLGQTVFDQELVSNTIEIRDKYAFWGEPEIYYTDILKQYRFDVFTGERFLTEAYLFDDITTRYPLVYTNIPMMVKEFFAGGLTDNGLKIRIESPQGACAYYIKRFALSDGMRNKGKAVINYYRFAYWQQPKPKTRPRFGLYTLLARPIAWLMYLKDKKEYKKKK